MTKVSSNFRVELALQPFDGEGFRCCSTTRDQNARLDIQASSFWGGRLESTFFDVRIFNPNVQSNLVFPVRSLHRQHQLQKCRKYEEPVIDIEQATFTPLVFSVACGCSQLSTIFMQRLAELTSAKRDEPYSEVIRWLLFTKSW